MSCSEKFWKKQNPLKKYKKGSRPSKFFPVNFKKLFRKFTLSNTVRPTAASNSQKLSDLNVFTCRNL